MKENNINNEVNNAEENNLHEENIENTNENKEKVEDMVNPPLTPKKKTSKTVILLIVCLIFSCLALVFSCLNFITNKNTTTTSKAPKILQKGDMKIAYVNTDTLLAKYNMAIDMEKNLKAKQAQMESSFKQKQATLQNDYQTYMKNGSSLTLTQQKAKEKELQTRMQELQQLQQELPNQLQEEQVNENKKLLDVVYAFIKDYNLKHDHYNIILSRSYSNSPTLYMDEGLDITDEIVKGLNDEYKNYKK
jgi:outer membrane protein